MTDELKNKVETDLETALKDLDHSVGKVAEDNVRDARPGNWTPQPTNPPAPRVTSVSKTTGDDCMLIHRVIATTNKLNQELLETLRLLGEIRKLS